MASNRKGERLNHTQWSSESCDYPDFWLLHAKDLKGANGPELVFLKIADPFWVLDKLAKCACSLYLFERKAPSTFNRTAPWPWTLLDGGWLRAWADDGYCRKSPIALTFCLRKEARLGLQESPGLCAGKSQTVSSEAASPHFHGWQMGL